MTEIGILENTYNISVQRTVNEVWQSSFSLPKTDPKNSLCSHLNYIEIISPSGRNYGLYRIMPTETIKSTDDDSITYKCEHVLATLMDDVIDDYLQLTGYSTANALQAILNYQDTQRWVLGQVDFNYFFNYSYENENGLLAPLLSIPVPFAEPYEFTFDTTVFPWVLNLIRPSDDVKAEIRWGKDMIEFNKVSDPTEIVNYIIPKGTGEGVNQLTIASVNEGLKYLKDDASIAQWGKRSYIWIDKSYENAQLLKNSAQSLINQWKDPKISFEVGSADLSILPEYAQERKVLNGVTRIIVEDEEYLARIIGEEVGDITKEYEVSYQISNKLDDIATTQADMERKQQVAAAYAQGATNIMNFSYQDNCDNLIPALIPFYIDDDVVNVNTCELTFRTKPFRAYEKAIAGGGATTKTSTDSNIPIIRVNSDISEPYSGDHRHKVTIASDFVLHTHNIVLEDHVHEIEFGIYESDLQAEAVQIWIDGNAYPTTEISGDRIDLVDYLSKDGNGKVTRGRHEILMYPSTLARIEADVILRVFIQSRIGGVY
ncbi:phage tail protein [Mobilitalea sibirica]|uniref:Phage tail protein n=2 Tax=Mobilitalea sibirica TaxID=1462919 RepID=A0A8J7HE57_9FIRM|nr:phage tail protein [Mobilitalea sibirica]